MSLAEAAIKLAGKKAIMDSYYAYNKILNGQNWFFSPNPKLDNATVRPKSFPTTSDKLKQVWWADFTLGQRMTISTIAGFGHEGKNINFDNKIQFSKLKRAWQLWPEDLYSIFWQGGEGLWLCNVFVGDAIYLHDKNFNFMLNNNHYYTPSQIYNGKSPLKIRTSDKDVQVGDIVVFNNDYGEGEHVEIITKIQRNHMCDDGFCSIGVGRGGTRRDTGSIRCDDSWASEDKREFNHKNTFYSIDSLPSSTPTESLIIRKRRRNHYNTM